MDEITHMFKQLSFNDISILSDELSTLNIKDNDSIDFIIEEVDKLKINKVCKRLSYEMINNEITTFKKIATSENFKKSLIFLWIHSQAIKWTHHHDFVPPFVF